MSDNVERVRPPEAGSEWDTLTQLLDFVRATVAWKASGLTDDQARRRPLPVSELTVASIVKHLTGVERFWFSIDFADQNVPWPWTEEDSHGNFSLGAEDTIDQLIADYLTECKRSNEAIEGATLEDVARSPDMEFTLRYALTHMIEETARHCGHMDLLREQIDGFTGE